MTDEARRGLGRVRIEDERDTDYPISAMFGDTSTKTSADEGYQYWWTSGWWGDQGTDPHCVAFAWMHWLEDGPVTHFYEDREFDPWYADEDQQCLFNPRGVYAEAQQRDRWPGSNYAGTSVRAGAKVLEDRGVISEYRWAWTLDEMIEAVLTLGPVVVGSKWYSDMYSPDSEGIVSATGDAVGGHAYVVNGVNVEKGLARAKNSWSRSWGDDGHFWIPLEPDMKRLVEGGGEVCLATETPLRD